MILNMPILLLILISAFIVKIPVLTAPIIGYFGSYQAVNAQMAEMMLQSSGFADFMIPKLAMLVEGKPGLHLLYYPFGSFFAFLAQSLAGGEIDFWGRFQAAFFMLGNGYLVYTIAKHYYAERTALLACFLFSFFPMNLLMGINFQNESVAIFLLLSTFVFLHRRSSGAAAIAGLCFSLAAIARIHFILVFPAFFLFLILKKRGWFQATLFCLCSGILLFAWYGFLYSVFKESPDSVNTSIFSQAGDGRILNHPLIRESRFYASLFDTLVLRSMTPVGFVFLLIGCMRAKWESIVFYIWLLAGLACAILFPQKVFDHPFYLIFILPPAAMIAAEEIFKIATKKKYFILTLMVFFLFSLRYYSPSAWSSWAPEAVAVRQMGREVEAITKPHEFVIASNSTSPEFLYYTKRKGWPFDLQMARRKLENRVYIRNAQKSGYGNPIQWLEYLKSQGAAYFIVTEPVLLNKQESFAEYLTSKYSVIDQTNPDMIIYDLRS